MRPCSIIFQHLRCGASFGESNATDLVFADADVLLTESEDPGGSRSDV